MAAERALRETEAELARVVRALSVGELATSIAHEINQPLAGVVTNAEAGLRWLSGREPNLEEARESLELIARDGNRAGAVIRRIRTFLKKEGPQAVSLDLNEVIQETAAFARPELQKRDVALRFACSGDLPRVLGDRVQLQQVILNMIMNAAEAMESTEGAKHLVITSRQSAEEGVIVAVQDSGIGMSPTEVHRMFDPFFTTKPTGMGIGLSISRTIIEAHGGRIWATRNEDAGLSVQFALPTEEFRAGRRHGAMSPERGVVFVVDDDTSVRDALQNLLRSVGLYVQASANAQEFLSSKRPDTPGCLVLDVRLPGASGLDLQRQLIEAHIQIPIVFLTGHGDIPMSVRAMKAGAIEFLTKPFRDQDLLDAVQQAIEQDRVARLQNAEVAALRERYDSLTTREQEVLNLVAQGLLNKQIGGKLQISEPTVKLHRGRVMHKMSADSLASLIRMAEKLGIANSMWPPAGAF